MKNYENGELIIDLYAVPPRVQNAARDQVPESSLMGQTLEVSFHHIPCQNQNQWSERFHSWPRANPLTFLFLPKFPMFKLIFVHLQAHTSVCLFYR